MNLTFRLNRLILGESMLVPREIVKRTERLEVVKPRLVQGREPRDVRTHEIRASRNVVEAGPNAPQLKRLIQHPYTQELSRPKAGKPWRQPLEPPMSLEPFGSGVRAAFEEGERPRWPKVTRDRVGLPHRERPSLAEYLATEVTDG